MVEIRERLQNEIQSYSKTHQKVAIFLMENLRRIKEFELNDIAEITGVSRSSILRFFKEIGFTGYRELKQYITSSDGSQEGDPLISWVTESTELVVRQTIATLDYQTLNEAISRCAGASRIFWYGVGESGMLAELANYRCWLMGIESNFCREMSNFDGFAHMIRSSEVLIVISRRGNGDYLYEPLENIKHKNIFTIGITSNRLSWLAQNASLCLFPLSREASIGTRHVPMRAGYEMLHNALIFGTARQRGIHFRLGEDYGLIEGGGV